MPTKRQRRKRRKRISADEGGSSESAPRIASATAPRRSGAAARRGGAALPARRGSDDRPSAAWGTFPLTEIVIFVGLVLLVVGFFVPPPQGFVMIAVGLALGSLAGLELAIREHFAAYRSHNLLLSAAIGVPVFGVLFLATKLSPAICIAAGLVAFGGAAWLFASAFRRRSGGALYRFGR
jgi:hypothetical protein